MDAFFELGFGMLHVLENGFVDGDVPGKTFDDLVAKFSHQRRDTLLRAVISTRIPDESDERKNLRQQLLALSGSTRV